MSVLDEFLKNHRKKIIDREEQTFRELFAVYADLEKNLSEQFTKLQKQILDARTDGEEISPAWLYRQRRLKNLLAAVKAEMKRFGEKATNIVEREQRGAIELAVDFAAESLNLIAKDKDIGAELPKRFIETAVGMMGDGSPIKSYFEQQLTEIVAEKIKSEVIKAVALGTGFENLAKNLTATGGITKSRALSVARTEVNRVRREATRQVYAENSDIITKWEWVASKSPRTCVLCLALDGEQFDLEEPFPQHINCRCSMIAVIEDLPRPKRTLGKDWFDNQSDEVKKSIIGADGWAAYQNGDIDLKDFVKFRSDKRFGKSVTRKPLAQILADKNISADDLNKLKAQELAGNLLAIAKANEPDITTDTKAVAIETKAQIVGLENKLKSSESLVRKILDYSRSKEQSLKKTADNINDVLRYTYLLPENSYFATSQNIREAFAGKGYQVRKVFDGWKTAGTRRDVWYRGINVTLISSQNQIFELQLHTKQSFSLKEETHDLYEEWRMASTTPQRRSELEQKQLKMAERVKKPK